MTVLQFKPIPPVLAGPARGRHSGAVLVDERARQHRSDCIGWTFAAYGFGALAVISVASGYPLGMLLLIAAAGMCCRWAMQDMNKMAGAMFDRGIAQGHREGRRSMCADLDRIEGKELAI